MNVPQHWVRTGWLIALFSLSASLAAYGQPPVITFYGLPDDLPGPGSTSMITGTVTDPLSSLSESLSFDLTTGEDTDEAAWMTFARSGSQLSEFDLLALRMVAVDDARGVTLILERDAALPGSLLSSVPWGGFPAGAFVTASLPVTLSVVMHPGAAPLQVSLPPTATLTLGGTLIAGFFHQVLPLTGALSGLPGLTVALLAKEDLFPPSVEWVASAGPTGSIELATNSAIQGSLVLARDLVDFRMYQVVGGSLSAGAAAQLIVPNPASSANSLTLDPVSSTITGQIDFLVDGVPWAAVVDGIGDSFLGPCTRPTAWNLSLSGGPLLGCVLALRKTALIAPVRRPVAGQPWTISFRGPPHSDYVTGASLEATPGINTPVGDVPIELDPLFAFSVAPGNGVFDQMLGLIPAAGEAQLTLTLPPPAAGLSGLSFFLGGAVLDLSQGRVLAVTNSHRVTLP